MAARLVPIASPQHALSEAEKDEFATFVQVAGKVTPVGLSGRVRRAAFLVRLLESGKLVGTAAIKVPDAGYLASVFAKANVQGPDRYPRELGYVVVADTHRGRGYSRDLVEAALAEVPGVALFATTSSSRMERTLLGQRFMTAGQPYPSTDPNEMLKLFLRPT